MEERMTGSLIACVLAVAAYYHIPPRVFPAIHDVEGGRPGSIHRNTDGSDDLGIMQINDRWVPAFSRYTGLPTLVVRQRLILDPCFNIAAAGAILRFHLVARHGDLMEAIGDYHSLTPAYNLAYQAEVLQSARRLFEEPSHRPATR
jgi:soluble lytic murein transglycosylase-like protein